MHGDIIWVSLSKKTNCCRTFAVANSDGGRNNRRNQLSKLSWIYNYWFCLNHILKHLTYNLQKKAVMWHAAIYFSEALFKGESLVHQLSISVTHGTASTEHLYSGSLGGGVSSSCINEYWFCFHHILKRLTYNISKRQ